MIPAIAVSFTAAELTGGLLQKALGLNENESLTGAGALGMAAAVFLALLLVSPQLIGIALGSKARRQGANRLGAVGLVLNVLVAAFVLLTMAVNVLLL